jgi:hypothetical protein
MGHLMKKVYRLLGNLGNAIADFGTNLQAFAKQLSSVGDILWNVGTDLSYYADEKEDLE